MSRLNQRLEQQVEASIDELMKDEDALALRNKTITEAMHQTPLRHRLRRLMLHLLANTYVPPSRRAQRAERILIIRPDHIGDVLLTTPAIHALREARPQTEIHALVGNWSAGVLENYNELDVILTIPFPGFVRGGKKNKDWRLPYQYAIQTARRLRRIGYSHALILRPDHWWGAWLARLAGIPQRIGYEHPDTALFLTQTIPHQHEHVVMQSLRLVEALTGEPQSAERAKYQFPVTELDHAFVHGYLSEWDIPPEKPLLCIHPGAGTKIKQWIPQRWAQVADILSEQLGAQVVFTGTDHEMPLIQEIISQMQNGAAIMAGDTQISQLAALYARARVVLGPDSGPLHLAAAVGTPTVTLYGPADPTEFRTWGNPQKHIALTYNIACRPCRILDWSTDDSKYHPCVRNISVTEVLNAARMAASYGEA